MSDGKDRRAKPADAFWIALSMYSILPAPRREWRKESMRAAICFLPLIGILTGGALALWQWLSLALNIAPAVFASVAAVLPVILTGGLHMDGFMDTADAIGSHRPREEKLEIMKDSHAGAFAVLWCGVYLLLSFGVYFALYEKAALWTLGIAFILSRALCALSALTLPSARGGGLLHAFTEHAKNRAAATAMIILSVICAASMTLLDRRIGLCCTALAAAAFFAYCGMARKLFGGATGDTSGFFIQVCELSLLYAALIGASL
ncbi:MAG: adenosylcobinamide-GDP ribazoletransferase [Clostridiales Family XIII bacterium]|jgi:adenosylcobinamide-GDP ribazoletransferase|nr:adenosylcobinamide-GDP ribazoletransferase [Clostridiales Family XIII bacterium]